MNKDQEIKEIDNFKNKVICGDCLEELKNLEDNSIDSIVTDPPYELGFMGKSWDNTGIANNQEMWKECLRVLKPGGHLLAFSGTRTYHRMASAIEDAGFEVRDMIEWVYGSGFPKSLNIGKAVDKLQGNERKVVGIDNNAERFKKYKEQDGNERKTFNDEITKGTSEWEGWGTALKPAHEPICMARKPLSEKTVAENVLKYGTGGINIDDSRVEYQSKEDMENNGFRKTNIQNLGKTQTENNTEEQRWSTGLKQMIVQKELGRFPANLIHDGSDEVVSLFPDTKSVRSKRGGATNGNGKNIDYGGFNKIETYEAGFNDSGSASRFFYCAKASKSERNKGCEDMEEVIHNDGRDESLDSGHMPQNRSNTPKKNFHPTVKPVKLMEYLIKMVTPKGGIVLDPFAGSGSTLVAAKQNGFQYIGIEMTEEYIPIINARLTNYEK